LGIFQLPILKIDPSNKSQRQLFIDLPFELYKDNSNWVPPIQLDTLKYFDTNRNPFFQHGNAVFFVYLSAAGKPLGRIAGLINYKYNQFNNETTGFFYLFESINDNKVSRELFSSVQLWFSQNNIKKIIGSKGFSTLDGIGILIEGFDHKPALGLPYNPEYYQHLIEDSGFLPETDLLSAVLDNTFTIPEKVIRASELLQNKKNFRVIQFKSKKEIVKFIPKLMELYNEAISGTTGNIPLTDRDIRSMADQLLWFADPSLIKIIMLHEKPIGFLLGYPDISNALIQTNGRFLPFGWIHLLQEANKTVHFNINGAGILNSYRGSGASAILYHEIYNSLKHSRYKHGEIVQIGADNSKMQLEAEALGIRFNKRHRLYFKNI
jgi:hypothetical protein